MRMLFNIPVVSHPLTIFKGLVGHYRARQQKTELGLPSSVSSMTDHQEMTGVTKAFSNYEDLLNQLEHIDKPSFDSISNENK